MKLLPMLQFVADPEGTRWTVRFAGPYIRRMLPGMQRHLVFRAGERQAIIEHDWIAHPPTDVDLLRLLAEARP